MWSNVAAGSYAFKAIATDNLGATGQSAVVNITVNGAPPTTRRPFDYDGDGKADISIWRPSEGKWYIINSSNGTQRIQAWGLPADRIVPADYDGDGKTDLAVWRPSEGNWYIINSSNGTQRIQQWGASTDLPVVGDYDGDGKADLAVFQPSGATWRILQSSTGTAAPVIAWGTGSDTLVPGDYDGDGKTDLAIWRPGNGHWIIRNSSNGTTRDTQWGLGTDPFNDVPASPADYDGDGKTDLAIWRPVEGSAQGIWYIIDSSTGAARPTIWLGRAGDKLVPADYDGDGRADQAIWRGLDGVSQGSWYIYQSTANTQRFVSWGLNGDVPTPQLRATPTTLNLPPACSISSPASGASFTALANITITASASDADGTVTQVEFFSGSTSLGIDTGSPYSVTWSNVAAGNYVITARATDNVGGMTTSAQVNIVVSSPGSPVPADGLTSVSYETGTNQINTAGWEYDAAGNQTRAMRADGTWQRSVYDAAGRLVRITNDAGMTLVTHTYGASSHRLITQDGGDSSNQRTYSVWDGDSVIAEYEETDGAPTTPRWVKSHIYLGARLLATISPNGASELVEYQHPDRLGTRLITNSSDTSVKEQATLPFGTALDAESTGATKRRFTSYERSGLTGLDYAVNRFYDPLQGRFTQVDPIGMSAAELINPQSLNLFAYVGNDPVNQVDPDGLFWGAIGRFFKAVGRFFSAVGNAIARFLSIRWVKIATLVASALLLLGVGGILKTILQVVLKVQSIASNAAAQLQLWGLAFQGKFKELGTIIGRSLLFAPLATIEGAIRVGAKEGWQNGTGFLGQIRGALRGAWSGFIQGLKKVYRTVTPWNRRHPGGSPGTGFKNLLIPAFGIFCGPGVIEADKSITPINSGDNGCRAHDLQYELLRAAKRLNLDENDEYGWPQLSAWASLLGISQVGSQAEADWLLVKSLFRATVGSFLVDAAFGVRTAHAYRFSMQVLFLGKIGVSKVF
jgi:RHS repeat-associated protein